jgi:hypothetical protein
MTFALTKEDGEVRWLDWFWRNELFTRANRPYLKSGLFDRPQGALFDLGFFFDRKVVKIECKRDYACERTGNLAVEYANALTGEPSGLSVTTAELWGIATGQKELYLGSVALLRHYVATAAPERDLPVAGDGNASVKLYRKHHLLQGAGFVRVDGLGKDDCHLAIRNLLRAEP